jgi:hypothetical protein
MALSRECALVPHACQTQSIGPSARAGVDAIHIVTATDMAPTIALQVRLILNFSAVEFSDRNVSTNPNVRCSDRQ